MIRLIDGAGRELGPTRPPGRTHHELSRTLGPGDVQEGYGNVSAGGLDVATAELGQQRTMLVEELVRRSLPAVFASDVDTDQLGPRTRRDPCGAPDEMIAAGRACERDDAHARASPTADRCRDVCGTR